MNLLQRRECYVAHFDMPGFKNAVLENTVEACNAVETLRIAMQDTLNSTIEITSSNEKISGRVRLYIFSDSILMFTQSDTPEDLLSIIVLSEGLFFKNTVYRVPLRGGISYGGFFVNEEHHLFCGVPFVKAYEIGENAQWLGVVIDDMVYDHFKGHPLFLRNKDRIVQWDVPTKGGILKTAWVLNWPKFMEYKKTPPLTAEDLYEVFKIIFKRPYEQLAEDAKVKYQNTAVFINWSFQTRHSL